MHFPSEVIQFASLVPQIRDRVAKLRLHAGHGAGNRPRADFGHECRRQRAKLNTLLPKAPNKSRLERSRTASALQRRKAGRSVHRGLHSLQ